MPISRKYRAFAPVAGVMLLSASLLRAADQPWKDKSIAEWTEADAKQVLLNSPWVKTARAGITGRVGEDRRREGGNMGQPQGIGYDGVDDGRPRPKFPTSLSDLFGPPKIPISPASAGITLHVRWEGASPVRAAELKAHQEPPILAGQGYNIAVYGVPNARVKGDPLSLGKPLKKLAALKREGLPDVRPTKVEVLQRQDGLVIVYLFPLSAEISKKDGLIFFNALIGRIVISQPFDTGEMEFQGKLEL